MNKNFIPCIKTMLFSHKFITEYIRNFALVYLDPTLSTLHDVATTLQCMPSEQAMMLNSLAGNGPLILQAVQSKSKTMNTITSVLGSCLLPGRWPATRSITGDAGCRKISAFLLTRLPRRTPSTCKFVVCDLLAYSLSDNASQYTDSSQILS